MGFPGGSDSKASACNPGDPGSVPGLGRSPGEGNGNPLQYSCLENSTDWGTWQATVHGVTKSLIRLSDFTSLHFIEMGIPEYLTCLLRNLYVGQEAIVRTVYGTTDWFKIEKGVWQCCLLSPCLSKLYTEHIMRNAGLEELQAGIKIGRRNMKLQIGRWYHS